MYGQTSSNLPASANPVLNTPCEVPVPGFFPDCQASGAYSQAYGGGTNDYFLTEFDDERNLVWSTYWGGDESTTIFADSPPKRLVVNPQNRDVFYLLALTTMPSTFPFVSSAGEFSYTPTSFAGVLDVVGKFETRNPVWVTGLDCPPVQGIGSRLFGLTMDESENLYISGSTSCFTPASGANQCQPSSNGEFPYCQETGFFAQTDGMGNPTFGGGERDAAIYSFSSNNQLRWATYFGGDGNDAGFAMAYDATFQRMYVTGLTTTHSNGSTTIPLVDIPGQDDYFQPVMGALNDTDAFISRFCLDGGSTSIDQEIGSAGPPPFLRAYPNPATDQLHLKILQTSLEPIEISLYSSLGSLVSQTSLTTHQTLDLHSLAHGWYFLRATHPTLGSHQQLILVQP
jgi:hypothetical protein